MATTMAELQDLMRELIAAQKETEQQMKETDRKFQETDRKFQETDRKFQETDRKFQEVSKESDRKFQEMVQENNQQFKRLNKQLGDLGNRLGEFVEEQVMPSALAMIQARGIAVHEMHRRVQAKRSGKTAEVDLLLVNNADVVAIEVKSALSLAHVDQHLSRLDQFKVMFPHYASLRLYGAVAGMVVPKESAEYAIAQGLFVLVPAAEIMQLANDPEFQPRIW